MSHWLDNLLRNGHTDSRAIRTDLFWLFGLALLLIATGIGWRDPWPADEPRFVLIASDMMRSGEWLIPQVGADIYADKPPLFFWLMSIAMTLTQSLRMGFLLPSLLAGVGCVVLVYDLARRLWNRETGLIAGLLLLFSIQFVWQARQAQIDAMLCLWTTLSLYGLLRHCLLGPSWRWYVIGWASAGLGIITKGVGFLPLLVLIPYAFMNRGTRAGPSSTGRWLLGPLALVLAVSIWLVPMLLAAQADPQIAAYRDEILFHQTVNRYADAWHHREPFWYFIVEVIPALWLPITVLLPWLWPHWRDAFRARERRITLPLIWVVLVVLFFSLSSGKRGVYVLPALPALALVAAPFIAQIAARSRAQRTLFGIACFIAVATLGGAMYLLADSAAHDKLIEQYSLDLTAPVLTIAVATMTACFISRPARGFLAYTLTVTAVLLVVSFWVNPAMNDARSGREFVRKVETLSAALQADSELGFVAYKEQYLLYLTRPIVNFGHGRWREEQQEIYDAAAWLAARPTRLLLVDDVARSSCFPAAKAYPVDTANRMRWWLVTGTAEAWCVNAGDATTARSYRRGQGLHPKP